MSANYKACCSESTHWRHLQWPRGECLSYAGSLDDAGSHRLDRQRLTTVHSTADAILAASLLGCIHVYLVRLTVLYYLAKLVVLFFKCNSQKIILLLFGRTCFLQWLLKNISGILTSLILPGHKMKQSTSPPEYYVAFHQSLFKIGFLVWKTQYLKRLTKSIYHL